MDESCTIWDLGVRQFTSDTVMEYSASQGITIEEALDTIVREWRQYKEIVETKLSSECVNTAALTRNLNCIGELTRDYYLNVFPLLRDAHSQIETSIEDEEE